jgi:phage tail-like protein
MEFTYPEPAFHFTVSIAGPAFAAQSLVGIDTSFSEVEGLEASMDVEEVREGGLNDYVHCLPTGSKYGHLILKRGVMNSLSYLSLWASATIGSNLANPIITNTLVVMLLGPDHCPRVAWNIHRAWPVRWNMGNLSSSRNEVLVESIEFAHAGIDRITLAELQAAAGVAAIAASR